LALRWPRRRWNAEYKPLRHCELPHTLRPGAGTLDELAPGLPRWVPRPLAHPRSFADYMQKRGSSTAGAARRTSSLCADAAPIDGAASSLLLGVDIDVRHLDHLCIGRDIHIDRINIDPGHLSARNIHVGKRTGLLDVGRAGT